jgi:hypothetical protein
MFAKKRPEGSLIGDVRAASVTETHLARGRWNLGQNRSLSVRTSLRSAPVRITRQPLRIATLLVELKQQNSLNYRPESLRLHTFQEATIGIGRIPRLLTLLVEVVVPLVSNIAHQLRQRAWCKCAQRFSGEETV